MYHLREKIIGEISEQLHKIHQLHCYVRKLGLCIYIFDGWEIFVTDSVKVLILVTDTFKVLIDCVNLYNTKAINNGGANLFDNFIIIHLYARNSQQK